MRRMFDVPFAKYIDCEVSGALERLDRMLLAERAPLRHITDASDVRCTFRAILRLRRFLYVGVVW